MFAEFIAAEVRAWIDSNKEGNTFAVSLDRQLSTKHSLSDGQIDAVRKLIERDKAKQYLLKNTDQNKIEGFGALAKAFDNAKAKGLKKPKMRFDGFTASLAPSTGKNPGAIYLSEQPSGEYLGKVVGETLHATSACNPFILEIIRKAMQQPFKSAVEFGRKTGSCSVCGRLLTDPESITNGIGPICSENFGF